MLKFIRTTIVFCLLGLSSMAAFAVVDLYDFDTESQRVRYYQLSEVLRCPKCQNQNLAGSDSQVAGDLRRELHRLLLEGKTDQEIKSFMVARYGEFVLYKPRLQGAAWLLWGLPLVLLLLGFIVLLVIMRHRRDRREHADLEETTEAPLSGDEQSRLEDLLEPSHSSGPPKS